MAEQLTPAEMAAIHHKYWEGKKQGAFHTNPAAAAWAHEVRARGLVHDPVPQARGAAGTAAAIAGMIAAPARDIQTQARANSAPPRHLYPPSAPSHTVHAPGAVAPARLAPPRRAVPPPVRYTAAPGQMVMGARHAPQGIIQTVNQGVGNAVAGLSNLLHSRDEEHQGPGLANEVARNFTGLFAGPVDTLADMMISEARARPKTPGQIVTRAFTPTAFQPSTRVVANAAVSPYRPLGLDATIDAAKAVPAALRGDTRPLKAAGREYQQVPAYAAANPLGTLLALAPFVPKALHGAAAVGEGIGAVRGIGHTIKNLDLTEPGGPRPLRPGVKGAPLPAPGVKRGVLPRAVVEPAPAPVRLPPGPKPAPKPAPTSGAAARLSAAEAEARARLAAKGQATQVPEPAPVALAPAPTATPPATSDPRLVSNFPTDQLHTDPERFQYKIGSGQGGQTGPLTGAKTFNPELAGVAHVWRDPADGKVYVVNGHNRKALADRTGAPGMDVRFLDAPTAEDARTTGALINIAEGQGSALDAAKLFRDQKMTPEELAQQGVNLSGEKARQGMALANLSPSLFGQVVRGEMPVERAAIIGSKLPDVADQMALVAELDKAAKRGKAVTNDTISEIADGIKDGPRHTETNASLFGDDTTTRSLAVERGEVAAYVKGQLVKEGAAFGGAAKNAGTLAKGNNVIDAEMSQQIADANRQGATLFDRVKNQRGPVSEILNRAAARLAKGENPNVVKSEALAEYQNAIPDLLKSGGADAGTKAGVGVGAADGNVRAGQEEAPGQVDLFAGSQAKPLIPPAQSLRPKVQAGLQRLDAEQATPRRDSRASSVIAEEDARLKQQAEYGKSQTGEPLFPEMRGQAAPSTVDRLDKVASDAAARIKTRNRGRLNSGLDPLDLADYAVIGAAKIAKGAVNFAAWSKDMAGEFGEAVRPHLQAIWDAARHVHDTAHADPSADIHATARARFASPQAKSPTEARSSAPAPSPAPETAIPAETPPPPAVPELPAEAPKPVATATPDELPENEMGLTMGHVKDIADQLGIGLPDKSEFKRPWTEVKAAALSDADAVNAHTEGKVSLNPALTMEQAYVGHLRLRQLTEDKIPAMLDEAQKSPGGEVQGRLDAAFAEAADLANTLYKGGSEAGRRLAFQKALVTDDLNTASVLTRAQAATGGKLSKEGAQTLTNLTGRAQKLKATLDGRLDAAADAALEQSTPATKTPSVVRNPAAPKFGESNQFATREDFQAALDSLSQKLKIAPAANPLTGGAEVIAHILPELTTIGKFYIEGGVRQFAAWAKQMRTHAPSATDDDLKAVWDGVRQDMAAAKAPARADKTAQRSADAMLSDMEAGFPARPKPTPHALATVGAREYAMGAKDLAAYTRAMNKRFQQKLPTDVLQRSFTEAAQRYRADYKGLADIKNQVAQTIAKEIYMRRSVGQKVLDTGKNVFQLFRTLNVTFDVSFLNRQGGFITKPNPRLTARALKPMFEALRGEDGAANADIAIRTRPNAKFAEESELHLSDTTGADITKQEEQYVSDWANKVPGVRLSERANVTLLNKVRADYFDALCRDAKRMHGGKDLTAEEGKALANLVNVGTGRGSLELLGHRLNGLLDPLFGPRWTASRFQILSGQPFRPGSAVTRVLVARTYLHYALARYTLKTLAVAAGAKIVTDPRSGDFMKALFGNVAVDFGSGFDNVVTLGARFLTGETATQAGSVRELDGSLPGGVMNTRTGVAARFVQGKLAPLPSTAVTLGLGKDFTGKPVTALGTKENLYLDGQVERLIAPLSLADVVQAAKQEGIPTALAVMALNTVGEGASVREPRPAKSGGGLYGGKSGAGSLYGGGRHNNLYSK